MDWLNVKARSFLGSLFRIPTRFKNGYHQFFDSVKGSWQWVHRRVAEIVTGKPIPPGYEVHHINREKLDNDPDNLQVLTKEEHRAIHRNERKKKVERITNNLTKKNPNIVFPDIILEQTEKIQLTEPNRIDLLFNAFKAFGNDRGGCPRCGGSGYLPQFSYYEGGVCFLCGGGGDLGYSNFENSGSEDYHNNEDEWDYDNFDNYDDYEYFDDRYDEPYDDFDDGYC